MKSVQKAVLMIIDGFGISKEIEGNAIYHAKTPNYDRLVNDSLFTELSASGNSVGLPNGVMGNSEVGHLTMGAGRIEFQSYEKINQSIKSGKIKTNTALTQSIEHVKQSGGNLHFFGLVSDGGVHSHINHLKFLVKFARQNCPNKIFIHAFTDGRDVPPTSAVIYISELLEFTSSLKDVYLSDIVGRFYAMDRDTRWERTKLAYSMLTSKRTSVIENCVDEINNRYQEGETDEFLKPILCDLDGTVSNGDGVIFFNFRPDRARQLTKLFVLPDKFDVIKISNLFFATMTEYEQGLPVHILFPSANVKNPIAEVFSSSNLKQIHIAETEKYAHVTYFFNGGKEEPFPLEDRILIPSRRDVPTYDLVPEMSTRQIGEKVIESIENGMYHFIVFNVAAPDMVGHTGNFDATVKAVEITDEVIGKVVDACIKNDYKFLLTADHGNAEKMLENGKPHTAHTTNPVPFIIFNHNNAIKLKEHEGLSNVSPTLLELVGLDKPIEMESNSIIV